MRALGFDVRPGVGHFGGTLKEFDIPMPTPAAGEVRVKVRASSINVDDIHIVEGTFAGGAPFGPRPSRKEIVVPGSDFAGVVDAVGPGVQLALGTAVYGFSNAFKGRGPWAEYIVVPASRASAIPPGVTYEEAAAAPMSGTTALRAIGRAGVDKGQACLVLGASGGIGSTCVQALCSLGAEVWGVCSSANVALVRDLGATQVIDYTERPLAESLRQRGRSFACALDFVGGRDLESSVVPYIDKAGSFVTVVGPVAYVGEAQLSLWQMLRMFGYIGLRTIGSRLWGPRYDFAAIREPYFQEIERLIWSRGKRALIDRILPLKLESVREGVSHVLSHRSRGRVVLSVSA